MTQSLPQHVAREVRAEMGRQRRTHRELAEALGISQPQVTKRLNGDIEFRPSELEQVAEMLGVPVTQFLPAAPAPTGSAAA
jgi:transcriptional regulator with XRE-family HTH domain